MIRVPRRSQPPRRGVNASPTQRQSNPSSLTACALHIRSVASGSSRGWVHTHMRHSSPSRQMTGSLTADPRIAGQHDAGHGARQPLGAAGLEQLDAPVLGAGGGTTHVEAPPPARSMDQGRTLEGLRPEELLRHRGEGLEVDLVVGAGEHNLDAPPRPLRAAHPMSEPHRRIDPYGAGGPGPARPVPCRERPRRPGSRWYRGIGGCGAPALSVRRPPTSDPERGTSCRRGPPRRGGAPRWRGGPAAGLPRPVSRTSGTDCSGGT